MWPQPSPLVLLWYTQDISSAHVKGFIFLSAFVLARLYFIVAVLLEALLVYSLFYPSMGYFVTCIIHHSHLGQNPCEEKIPHGTMYLGTKKKQTWGQNKMLHCLLAFASQIVEFGVPVKQFFQATQEGGEGVGLGEGGCFLDNLTCFSSTILNASVSMNQSFAQAERVNHVLFFLILHEKIFCGTL